MKQIEKYKESILVNISIGLYFIVGIFNLKIVYPNASLSKLICLLCLILVFIVLLIALMFIGYFIHNILNSPNIILNESDN